MATWDVDVWSLDVSEMIALKADLERNMALGILTVVHEGTARTFMSLDQMKDVREMLIRGIARASTTTRKSRAVLMRSGGFE